MDFHLFETVEGYVYQGAEWVKLVVELCGVAVIIWGVSVSMWLYANRIFTRKDRDFIPLRLSLAHYLVLALEFQLAADIIGTAIAPGWDQIGKLAAVAAIRTVLNYFLEKEIDAEVEAMKSGDKDKFRDRLDDAADTPTDDR